MNDFLQNLRNGQAEKQRTGKTRKSYDNSYRYSNPRFHSYPGYQQRTPVSQSLKRTSSTAGGNQLPAEESTLALLAEAIDNLSLNVEALAKNQEFLINAQDRAADMLERQAIAIESIVKYLHSMPGNQTVDMPPEASKTEALHSDDEDETMDTVSQFKTRRIPSKPEKKTKILKRTRQKVTKQIEIISPETDTGTDLLSREAVMDIIHTMRENGATYDEVAKRLIDLNQPTFSGRGEWHAQTIHRLCHKKKK